MIKDSACENVDKVILEVFNELLTKLNYLYTLVGSIFILTKSLQRSFGIIHDPIKFSYILNQDEKRSRCTRLSIFTTQISFPA